MTDCLDLAVPPVNGSKPDGLDAIIHHEAGLVFLHGMQRLREDPCDICYLECQIVRPAHDKWHPLCLYCLAQSAGTCPICRKRLPVYPPRSRSDASENGRDPLTDETDSVGSYVSGESGLYLDPPAVSDWDSAMIAVTEAPYLLASVFQEYRRDPEFMREAMRFNPAVADYLLPDPEYRPSGPL